MVLAALATVLVPDHPNDIHPLHHTSDHVSGNLQRLDNDLPATDTYSQQDIRDLRFLPDR